MGNEISEEGHSMRKILISLNCPKCGSGNFKRKYINPANRFKGEDFRACLDCGTPFYKPSSYFTAILFFVLGVAFIASGVVLGKPGPAAPGMFRWIMLGLGGLTAVVGIGLFVMRIFFLRLSDRLIREGFDFGPPVLDVETGKWNSAAVALQQENKMIMKELE